MQLFLIFTLLVLISSFSSADESKKTLDKERIVSASATVERDQENKIYYADIHLQNLSVGSKATVNVKLSNPFDEEIKFTGVSNKCACKRFRMRNSVVPANGETSFSFGIDVPSRNRTATYDSKVTLVNDKTPTIRLQLHYGLDGLVVFKNLISVVEFDDLDVTEKQLVLPILFTPPVQLSDLKVVPSENLTGIGVKIRENDTHGPHAQLTIPVDLVAEGNVRGQIFLKHEATNQVDSYLLTLKDARTSEISPSIVKFKLDDQKYVATTVVKIAGNVGKEAELISCRHNDKMLKVSSKYLASNTYQVTIRANKPFHTGEKSELIWTVNGAEIKTPFIIGD